MERQASDERVRCALPMPSPNFPIETFRRTPAFGQIVEPALTATNATFGRGRCALNADRNLRPPPYFDKAGNMDLCTALDALGALSQQTRLEAFRLLVKHEPDGLPAGEIANALGVPANTLSSHLAILARAGLVTSERRSRIIQYRSDIALFRDLMLFLAKDCCGGRDELCAPLVAELTCC